MSRCTSPDGGSTTSPIPDDAGTFRDRLRLHRSCLADLDQRRRKTGIHAGRTIGRELLCGASWPLSRSSAFPSPSTRCRTNCRIRSAFREDDRHASYDPDAVRRFFQILVNADRVFKQFRTGFLGKASPVHFFWGSFDLAVTRFSGRRAPRHPGGVPHLSDDVACEAYSHEVSSAGFWPGSGAIDYPAFYSYAYPEPPGFRTARVRPEAAFFSEDLANSSCLTMPCACPRSRTRRCSNSCKAPMRPRPMPRSGIAMRWNARWAGLAWCGRSNPLRKQSACRADGRPVRRATENAAIAARRDRATHREFRASRARCSHPSMAMGSRRNGA